MALTTGTMRVQAGGLNLNDQIALATYLTGRAPSDNPVDAAGEEPVRRRREVRAVHLAGGAVERLGPRISTTPAFSPSPASTAKDLPKLKLKWAFGYHGSSVYGQPTVVGGRVYVTSVTGRVYSLDAATGCTYWTYDAQGAVAHGDVARVCRQRSSGLSSATTPRTVYALNAADGKLLWKQRLDPAPLRADQRSAGGVRGQALRARVFARRAGGRDAGLSSAARSGAVWPRFRRATERCSGRPTPSTRKPRHRARRGRHAALRPGGRRRVVGADARSEAQGVVCGNGQLVHGRDRAARELHPGAVDGDRSHPLGQPGSSPGQLHCRLRCRARGPVRSRQGLPEGSAQLSGAGRTGRRSRHVADPSHATGRHSRC